ncbi:MAG TPA: tryptophan 2,3-dioxygenase family protein [Ktedonobacterales bacterium]|nr:tryptophan 2,3-dioxygenase family protein [Ktedonobacterales bacterium]
MSTQTGRRGAHRAKSGPTVYEAYIHTDELLALQKPDAERLHPDELLFQVVHQTFELWWKVTVQQLRAATGALQAGNPAEAAPALRRAVAQQELVRQVLRQLEALAPMDFLTIRTGLGDGSGMDSPGFRAILRAAPDLWSAFSQALFQAGLPLVEVYLHRREHLAWYECAEALLDFDEQFHLFRAAHLKLAERNLGMRAMGTGGTPMDLLARTLRDLLFPELWDVRDELLARAPRPASVVDGADPLAAGGH